MYDDPLMFDNLAGQDTSRPLVDDRLRNGSLASW